MNPAGLRLIAISENFDSLRHTDKKDLKRLFGKENNI